MKTTRLNFTTDWRGLTDYREALAVQQACWERRKNLPSDDVLLGFEHPAVITLGSRGRASEDLVGRDPQAFDKNRAVMKMRTWNAAVPVVTTDRGGQATLHSPGQLVIYPIFDLRARGLGVREFVAALQEATRRFLQNYGVESHPAEGAGLVTARGKIAFIGLRVERGITRHGLSLNVANDLALFGQIRSCGVRDAALDRLADHARAPNLPVLFEDWAGHFARILNS